VSMTTPASVCGDSPLMQGGALRWLRQNTSMDADDGRHQPGLSSAPTTDGRRRSAMNARLDDCRVGVVHDRCSM